MFGDVDFPQELRRNFLQLESTQGLLRYVSECNPMGKGTTKGGYMKGRVDVPFNGKKIWMRMKKLMNLSQEKLSSLSEQL